VASEFLVVHLLVAENVQWNVDQKPETAREQGKNDVQCVIEWSHTDGQSVPVGGIHEYIRVVVLLLQIFDFSHLSIENFAAMFALLGFCLNLFPTVLALLGCCVRHGTSLSYENL
jgi:hypothetical protein